MAKADGYVLLRSMRSSGCSKEIPIVLMSASEDLNIVIGCLEHGADDYILKPVRKEYLLNIWSNVWKRRQEAKQLKLMETQKTEMAIQMDSLASSVQNLRAQVNQAVETPIHVITRTIRQVAESNSLTEEVRQALSSIVSQFASYNLYRPSFDRVFTGESSDDALSLLAQLNTSTNALAAPSSTPSTSDPATQAWIRSELSIPSFQPPVGESAFPSSVASTDKTLFKDVPSEQKMILRSWDFNVWPYSEDDLISFFAIFFEDFDLLNQFDIDKQTLGRFLVAIRDKYHKSNPYHNFRHAWDVTHSIYLLLTCGAAAELLTPIDILALLVATISHDLDHTATSNMFLVNIGHPLAMLYNDLSPLENHHAAQLFRILMIPECNIFKNLPRDQFAYIRRSIISCIIATDLPRYHVEIVTKFENCLSSFSKDNPEHRQLLLEILLKSADISNPCRPFHIAKYWSYMVVDEFFAQGDREKDLCLPLSPFHDRETIHVTKTQMSFIRFVVQPLFSSLCVLLPKNASLLTTLDRNHCMWQALHDTLNTNPQFPEFDETQSTPTSSVPEDPELPIDSSLQESTESL